MKCLILAASFAVATGGILAAQAPAPFKLGTFQRDARTFVGIVLRDSVVVDLTAADAVVPGRTSAAPADMKDVIARYDAGVRDRINAIVRAVGPAGGARPAYVYDLSTLKVLPPVMPATLLNAAVNYRAHGEEMARRDGGSSPGLGGSGRGAAPPAGTATPGTRSAPGIWERRADDTRWNPYLFLKATSAIIADGEAIRIPAGRTQIDWECELGVVIGRTASRVPAAEAASYIFGYTIEHDVSDRGGRGDDRYGSSDWLIGKSHDTFAPLGPFITPKEFVPDPQKLPVKFTLNGQLMQDANTSFMIHTVNELLSFGSHILTLRPGDIIATGTPDGVGSARNPPIFLKGGDRTSCTYEGVGTLSNPVEGPVATATR
jgi:2-keto-4-pentenoate hydratase/2-oxohepta-3-ene-1,7-dioic acid hydratase in catechol pathway